MVFRKTHKNTFKPAATVARTQPPANSEKMGSPAMDKLFNDEFIILDGAMGTMLQRASPVGVIPEIYTLEHPEILENIHRAYIEAGSKIAYSNTFSSSAHKLSGSGHSVEEVIAASVAVAKKAEDKALVALDIGPIGEMLEPSGTLSFESAYAMFRVRF